MIETLSGPGGFVEIPGAEPVVFGQWSLVIHHESDTGLSSWSGSFEGIDVETQQLYGETVSIVFADDSQEAGWEAKAIIGRSSGHEVMFQGTSVLTPVEIESEDS